MIPTSGPSIHTCHEIAVLADQRRRPGSPSTQTPRGMHRTARASRTPQTDSGPLRQDHQPGRPRPPRRHTDQRVTDDNATVRADIATSTPHPHFSTGDGSRSSTPNGEITPGMTKLTQLRQTSPHLCPGQASPSGSPKRRAERVESRPVQPQTFARRESGVRALRSARELIGSSVPSWSHRSVQKRSSLQRPCWISRCCCLQG